MEKLKIFIVAIVAIFAFATCNEKEVPDNENIVLKVIELKMAEAAGATDIEPKEKPACRMKCAAISNSSKINRSKVNPKVKGSDGQMDMSSGKPTDIHFNISMEDSNGKREICFSLMDLIRMRNGA